MDVSTKDIFHNELDLNHVEEALVSLEVFNNVISRLKIHLTMALSTDVNTNKVDYSKI